MLIAQVANFVNPTSGGIRTTMRRLRTGYAEHGHTTVQIIPGPRSVREETPDGVVHQVKAPVIPRSGGYRMIIDLDAVTDLLTELGPDRIEVNDRFTLRALGPWASAHQIPSVIVVHERLDRLALLYVPWFLRPGVMARWDNVRVADMFDTVVSPSRWGAQEFVHAGVDDVNVVSWGVDYDTFHPGLRDLEARARFAEGATVLIAMVVRLSAEKKPESGVEAVQALLDRGVDARLVVAGTGAMDGALRRRAADLPVTFLGHLDGREAVGELLASADVAICPGPIETFGLAALEAMACGTPVVSSVSGAIAELLDEPYGIPAHNHGPSMAGAVERLLDNGDEARQAARAAATRYPWSRSIGSMLHLHGLADLPEGADLSPVR